MEGILPGIRALVSLLLGFHPQTNSQMEHANQELESSLRCMVAHLPALHLLWIEYAHSSLVSWATGMSPFMVMCGFLPPLFPSQESEVVVPSVQSILHCARQVWLEAQAALDRTAARNQRLADRHPSP